MNLETAISDTVSRAIAARVFPGAVVLIARHGELLYHASYGSTMYEAPGSRPVARDTIYDVASLTKMFTATAALQLVGAGRIALDAPVRSYLPRFQPPDVTIWHLLTHTSGIDIRLSALRELEPTGMLEAVYATAPQRAPGSAVAYTNVNSLLLGEIIARLQGMPLDQALRETLIQPLGLRNTQFQPPAALRSRIAPTEIDATWRGGLVHGAVHDESTYALGGVAGHAGLFSNAEDLFKFCQAWLNTLIDEGLKPAILQPPIARMATTNQTPALNAACGLGWMIDRPNFMGSAPAGSFGHTGFTGPAMIVVPAKQTVVIILSNRVYPQRGPATHHAVTAALVEAAIA